MKTGRDILYLAIITLITAVGWVVFDAYHAYTISNISPKLVEIAIPLTPTLNREVIDGLKLRREPQVTIPVIAPVNSASLAATLVASGAGNVTTGSGTLR